MENYEDVRQLHQKVLNDLFRILLLHKIVLQTSSTRASRLPLYFISEEYRFLFAEIPSQISPYSDSLNRLLETRFLKLITNGSKEYIFFIKSCDMEQLTSEEKAYYTLLPQQKLDFTLEKETKIQLLG